MCTSITWRRGDTYFGRNLDLELSYGEKVVVTPRNHQFLLKNGQEYRNRYALMGMGLAVQDYPLYYEAFNEKGLAMAGLNLPVSAVYQDRKEGMDNITPFELLPWILGQATTVAEVRTLLSRLNLLKVPFGPEMPLAPLHFMISDCKESIVVEPVQEGLRIYDNPYEVMTNEPPFEFQLWNLQQYRHLSPKNQETAFTARNSMQSYAVGMGAVGLPGDASSISRFVRAAFHLENSDCEDTEAACVGQIFHVLDSVAMVKGATFTDHGKQDITVYSCCMDLEKRRYYYKTYDNSQITVLHMDHAHLDGEHLTVYELNRTQNFQEGN